MADGLLTLARARQRRTPPLESPCRHAPVPALPAPPPAPIIYGGDDASVTVPVALTQEMPPWRLPTNIRNGVTLSGLVRVIIDETGKVESATMLRAIHPSYDIGAPRAARTWTSSPALKDGQPVKYAKVIEVQLQE